MLSKKTGATDPKATKPKATKPKATKPKATKPKATKPKATKTEATKTSNDGGNPKEDGAVVELNEDEPKVAEQKDATSGVDASVGNVS